MRLDLRVPGGQGNDDLLGGPAEWGGGIAFVLFLTLPPSDPWSIGAVLDGDPKVEQTFSQGVSFFPVPGLSSPLPLAHQRRDLRGPGLDGGLLPEQPENPAELQQRPSPGSG